jgi:hypothetical protein
MVITEPVLYDGYIEREMALVEDAAPIIKLRAVLTSEGKYKPIVRDHNTGHALVVGMIKYTNPQDCLRAAQNLAINFMTERLNVIEQL